MKIQYVSDIHLEFHNKIPNIEPIGDVLVLAGDIGYPFSGLYSQLLIDVNNKFNRVYIITGNHEFYNYGKNKGKSMDEIISQIYSIIDTYKLSNVKFLYQSSDDYQTENELVRFVGCTLWTKIKNPMYLINDFESIPDMDVDLYNELNNDDVEYLNRVIDETEYEKVNNVINIKLVIITHHMPSYNIIDSKFKIGDMNNYNQCFANKLDSIIKDPITLWVYGHTHIPRIDKINGVNVVCNPIGYPNENKVKEYNKIIEI